MSKICLAHGSHRVPQDRRILPKCRASLQAQNRTPRSRPFGLPSAGLSGIPDKPGDMRPNQARQIWYNIDNMSEYVKALTPSLFWDVNRDEVDDDRHRRFIMQRVLERGTMDDWRLTKRRYSLPLIVAEAQQMRSLEPRALAFIACLGDVDESSFRCSALKQSHQRHWFY